MLENRDLKIYDRVMDGSLVPLVEDWERFVGKDDFLRDHIRYSIGRVMMAEVCFPQLYAKVREEIDNEAC